MPQDPIAIIGIACRFPRSDGLDAFWQTLVQGRDCTGVVPSERWDAGRFTGHAPGEPGRTYCAAVGMDPDGDCYDAAFFGLTPDEAQRMDPQQGTVLELAWHACEDAGIAPRSLVDRDVGVFLGVSTRDFDRRMANLWQHVNERTSTGASGAVIANRLSYLFGLTGPSVAIDAACASSLASVHLACRAINDAECTLAFAGGVQHILSPANILAYAQGGLLARDGRCKPFSAQADGYICGEGAGLLLLKPLERALRDGDPIRAVIRGSAINHNGRSNGLSAPYRSGQQRVISKALERAGVAAASVDYVEAHAPGTLIGDAIEMQTIRDVYGADRPADRPCFVGSVKSNIGHLEGAAGIAALVKAALAVERGLLPASLHCTPPSELLRLDQSPIRLCDVTREWRSTEEPRRAGVSAFSFAGGNAHLVVEQPPTHHDADHTEAVGPWMLAVSARSEAAFVRLCAAYADSLAEARHAGAPLAALRDFCRATLVHRQHHAMRRALTVADWGDAIDALRAAGPATSANRPCRVGLIALKHTTTDGHTAELVGGWRTLTADIAAAPAGQRVTCLLAVMLARLGITRIHLDMPATVSPPLAALGEFASHLGLAVTACDADAPGSANSVVIVDASEGDAPCDLWWNPQDDLPGQCTRLAAGLFNRGFTLHWQGFATLTGGAPARLPLYPFERRRNHVIPDGLAPDPADGGAVSDQPHTILSRVSS
ncbi:MAG: beta-ketoacyl synthase N-terminal-like domain-containing protein [Aquisalimonadaceae bacterium]